METGSLGDVHEAVKLFDPEWSLGIITTRYPRTTPNDLAVLRLKGFLKDLVSFKLNLVHSTRLFN